MFLYLSIAIGFSAAPKACLSAPEARLSDGPTRDRLTVIAARLECFYVPPRKGGTFCFPGLVADAMRAPRPALNPQ
jgi:hypothetical protein